MQATTGTNPTVAFYTLGCKLNFSETSAIGRQFMEEGYRKVSFTEGADVYVINTCSVTDHADKKCRKVVQQALKHNPNAYVAVIGCYAQLKPDEILEIPGVRMVLGAQEKFSLPQHIQAQKHTEVPVKIAGDISEVNRFTTSWSAGDRTRSFLKVQDGCNYSCSFCTIPLARGRSRSGSPESLIAQAESIAASGIREIVLTGVNIGDYGLSGEDQNRFRIYGTFLDLIKKLDEVEGVKRYRISSIEPNLLSNDIIRFVAESKRFVPHFHIPLQSGCDKILRLMRRRYLRALYAERVSTIKRLMPDACIGVDVIVGFPGETEEDFLDTYQFLQSLDISYLHVFTYSERANTPAAEMEPITPRIRHERNTQLQSLSDKKRYAFYRSQLGKTATVLFEQEEKEDMMYGFTEQYVKVAAPYDPLLVNEMVPVRLMEIREDGLVKVQVLHELPQQKLVSTPGL